MPTCVNIVFNSPMKEKFYLNLLYDCEPNDGMICYSCFSGKIIVECNKDVIKYEDININNTDRSDNGQNNTSDNGQNNTSDNGQNNTSDNDQNNTSDKGQNNTYSDSTWRFNVVPENVKHLLDTDTETHNLILWRIYKKYNKIINNSLPNVLQDIIVDYLLPRTYCNGSDSINERFGRRFPIKIYENSEILSFYCERNKREYTKKNKQSNKGMLYYHECLVDIEKSVLYNDFDSDLNGNNVFGVNENNSFISLTHGEVNIEFVFITDEYYVPFD